MPDTPKIFIVPEECDGMRADKALAEMLPEMSRSRIQKIIDALRENGQADKYLIAMKYLETMKSLLLLALYLEARNK